MMKKLLFVIAILALVVISPVGALAWTNAGGCWTASDAIYGYIKINASGSGMLPLPAGVTHVDFEMTGAGAGGGSGTVGVAYDGGGGGSGGFINVTGYSVSVNVPYTVGAKGAGAASDGQCGGSGGNTLFGVYSALGGGGGGGHTCSPGNGGSGGGGSNGAGGTGTLGQGNSGGTGTGPSNTAGGGGGNKTAGGNGKATNTEGGDGGAGVVGWITGEPQALSCGGSGAGLLTTGVAGNASGMSCAGTGGINTAAGTSATPSSGSGGGGTTRRSAYVAGDGSDGVIYIRYDLAAAPVAAFTQNQTSGIYPLVVEFIDTSTNTPTSWQWAVNGVNESTSRNYTRLFNSGGNYSINLTATNSVGSGWITHYVEVYNASSGGFSANVTAGSRPLQVGFTDGSLNATSWYYEFGDGNTSTSRNPNFTYNIAGTYSVNQRVNNTISTTWYNRTNYIVVSNGLFTIAANYTATNQTGSVPLVVTLTDSSTYFNSTPATYFWDFGDVTNSTSRNTTHTYSIGGTYWINYTVSNTTEGISSYMRMPFTATVPTGLNIQDVVMDPIFTFIIHITDSSTGIPILSASVTDASTGVIYTTTNGTVIIETPYTTLAGWIQAEGYDPEPFSKVIDEDMSETYALTRSTTSNSSQVQYSSAHNVKILVKDAWIGPIEGVNVTATYVEASGPFDWLYAWIGVLSGSGANVQNTTLYGHTGTDGAINFLMVESVQYNITATKPGIVSKSMLIYPKDDDYTIWTQEMNSSFLYESGYNELEEVQIAVNGTEVNQTYGKIMVTYYDRLNDTNFVFITVNQSVVSGNSTIEHSVLNTTITGDSDFTSTLYVQNQRDQSYMVHVLPNHTVFGNMSRDFGVTFPPGPISLGLPENLLHIIGMGMLFFIVLLFVRTLPGETVIVITFFAWIFFFMRWWTQMAPYYIMLGALTGMTVFAIMYNIVLRSKKVILS